MAGCAGRRTAHFDRLRFIPVPDPGTRVNGLRADDYDYAESVPSDLFDELDVDASINVVLNGGPIFGLVFMNSKAGPLQSNFELRQAIRAALDTERRPARIDRTGEAVARQRLVPADPPNPAAPPAGCRYHPRFAHATGICISGNPPLGPVGVDRYVARCG